MGEPNTTRYRTDSAIAYNILCLMGRAGFPGLLGGSQPVPAITARPGINGPGAGGQANPHGVLPQRILSP